MKGGVGKTTVTAHIGGMLCRYEYGNRKRSVLMIDYDPQFNLSQAYLEAANYAQLERENKTVLSVLLDDPTTLDPFSVIVPGSEEPPALEEIEYVIREKEIYWERFAIVPSTLDLMYVALGETDHQTKPIEARFKKFIAEAAKKYDLVLIDCHPAGSIFTKTALKNSDHVIIPVVPERYSARGVGLLLRFIQSQKVGDIGPSPHILFNRMPISKTSPIESTIRSSERYSKLCLTQTLKEYGAFREPIEGKGFVWHSGKPYSTHAFRNLSAVTREIVATLGI